MGIDDINKGVLPKSLKEVLNSVLRPTSNSDKSLKIEETPIVPMQDIYYNYVRLHESLEGKTPAETAGIGIEDKNKWLGLIKRSLNNQTNLTKLK